MYRGRKWFIVGILLACAALPAPGTCEARVRVGVIGVEARYPNADSLREIAEMLGHEADIIDEDVLSSPGELDLYGCVIFSHRYNLYESELEALAGYVKRGGTLLLTDTAGFWMAENPETRLEGAKRIVGRIKPLQESTGVESIGSRGAAKKFRVLERNDLTEGLPDEFEYETRPPYDASNPHRHTEIRLFEIAGADTVIQVEAYFNGEAGKAPFLTVKEYGDGKAVRIGCRVHYLIGSYSENHILRIFNNVLNSAG